MQSVYIDDWNNMDGHVESVLFVGRENALNSPSGTYFTAINFPSDANHMYKKLLGIDLFGNIYTRKQHAGTWDGWEKLTAIANIPQNILTTDRIFVSPTQPANPKEGDIWFKRSV